MGAKHSVILAPKEKVQLLVKTGFHKGKGTDALVHVILHDSIGRKTKVIELNCRSRDNFGSGCIDIFPVDLR